MIYTDIFEAIRACSPQDIVLSIKDRAGTGRLVRSLSFDALGTGKGDFVILPRTGMNILFYRGQTDASWPAIPSTYREATPETLMVDSIKFLDFSIILERFPQVRCARKQGVRVDTLALAQHYGLRTDMLDLTSDIAVAAFFATTQFKNGRFVPVENGIGSISRMLILMGMMEDDEIFRPVGLQPFQRPGQQCAFGIKLAEGQTIDDLQFVDTLQFHQDRACGQAFLELFGSEMPNSLFPQETIARIGTKIRRSNIVTQAAVSAYCKEQGLSQDTVKQTLGGMGISIEPKPVFDPSPRQLAKERMQVMRHGAFGGEIIFSRLTYLPGG